LIGSFDPKIYQNIGFSFFLDEAAYKQSTKKKVYREPFNKAYTLNDISEAMDSLHQKQLYLSYRVILENGIVPNELMKRLPNPTAISENSLGKLLKKVKNSAGLMNFTNNMTLNADKSNFTNYNYSRMMENSIFAPPLQNLAESRPIDQMNFDSFNNFEESFRSPVKNDRDNTGKISATKKSNGRKTDLGHGLSDFREIGKFIKNGDNPVKKIDPSKIESLKPKPEEKLRRPFSIKSSENLEEPMSMNLEHAVNISQSKDTKKSFKYEEGLQLLYDKISSLN
jgi:hypothetical protein